MAATRPPDEVPRAAFRLSFPVPFPFPFPFPFRSRVNDLSEGGLVPERPVPEHVPVPVPFPTRGREPPTLWARAVRKALSYAGKDALCSVGFPINP